MNKTEYDYLKFKYDQNCKKLLKNKAILANIMKYLIKDYKDMDIQTIMNYIEDGEQTPLIKGQNNEDYSPDGSEIEYDVLYTAKKPNDNSPIKIIINIEVQNNIYLKYPNNGRNK